jgi:pyruvate/2-oxoacid:ferredoxin oxidoreductase beta subunit
MELNTPEQELMYSGHTACPGCGAAIAMSLLLKALGDKTMMVLPACCWSVIAGPYPQSALKIPVIHSAFETGGAVASGVRAALDMKGDTETTVVTWAGDGGTFDIGFQSLSGAVERNENFIYVCYDNEAYMNTGIQRSSGTPMGASTTTAPAGKVSMGQKTWKKNMPEIMVAHEIPYVATVCPSYPLDFIRKIEKAKSIKGPSYIHCFSMCPTGWRSPSQTAISMGRLAVETGVFPLFEVEHGHYRLSPDMPKKLKPIKDYFKPQGRFRHLIPDEIDMIQERVTIEFKKLTEKAKFLKTGND